MALLIPSSHRGLAAVSVAATEGKVVVRSPERIDEVVAACKERGYRWDPAAKAWALAVGPTLGDPADRAAEIAHALLTVGVPVEAEESIAQAAVSGAFAPIHPRWIDAAGGKMADWLAVTIDDRDACKHLARIGKLSYYQRNTYLVHPSHWRELVDMAERHDIRVTQQAENLLREAREREESALVVADLPKAPSAVIRERKVSLEDGAVHPELRDD